MKKIIFSLLFLSLISFSFAADDPVCNTSFSEHLNVRALDAEYRPLENVSVTAYYQLSSSTGKGYTTSIPKLTGSNGSVYIRIQNLEKQEEHLDCDIVITGTYDDKEVSETVVAYHHATLIDLKFDVYSVIFTVKDQDGNKLSGVKISSGSIMQTTDENGQALLRVGSGEKIFFASYSGAEREVDLLVDEDKDYSISFFLSGVIINVVDDFGNPLVADVVFGTETYQTNEQGQVIVPSVGIMEPEITVIYAGIEKSPDIDLSREDEYRVVFDFTPPTVESINEENTPEAAKLLMKISDPGLYASGVNPSTLNVKYDLGEGWKDAKIYIKNGDTYVAEMDPAPTDSVIFFEIYVEDNDGNSLTVPGQYVVTNVVDDGSDDENNDGNEQEMDVVGLIINAVGFLVIVVVIYSIYKKFFNRDE